MFKNLKLKWKISIIVTVLIIIVMGAVSFVTYEYTRNMVTDQINSKIDLVKGYQKDTFKDLINNLEKQINYFASNEDFYNYLSMFNLMVTDGNGNVKKSYEQMVLDNSSSLAKQLQNEGAFKFSYITTNKGIVAADSRLKNNSDIKSLIGKKLTLAQFKNATPDKVYRSGKTPVIYLSVPIIEKGNDQPYGYYVIAVSLQYFADKIHSSSFTEGNIQLLNQKGIIYNSNDQQLVGKTIDDNWFLTQMKKGVSSVKQINNNNKYKFIEQLNKNSRLYLAISIPTNVINSPVQKLGNIILIIGLLGIVLVFASGYFLLSQQLKPINKLVGSFKSLEQGNLKEDIFINEKIVQRKDEIGILASAFNGMISQFKNVIKNINDASSQVASSSQQLQQVSNEVGDVSQQVAESIQEVATGADQQSENVERIDEKVKNLAQGISSLTTSSQGMESLTTEMTNSTETGQAEINKVSNQMGNIKNSIDEVAVGINNLNQISEEIDSILEIINNIANQTNLLALNAAIEAARAGQAGQGFSVVADEIRGLAEESVRSAEKISDLIQEIKNETKDASQKMEEGSKQIRNGEDVIKSAKQAFDQIQVSIKEVVSGVNNSIKFVSNINENSQEIVANIDNIATISEQTSASSQEVAAASEEQTASVEEVMSMADTLSEMADKLNGLVHKFELD